MSSRQIRSGQGQPTGSRRASSPRDVPQLLSALQCPPSSPSSRSRSPCLPGAARSVSAGRPWRAPPRPPWPRDLPRVSAEDPSSSAERCTGRPPARPRFLEGSTGFRAQHRDLVPTPQPLPPHLSPEEEGRARGQSSGALWGLCGQWGGRSGSSVFELGSVQWTVLFLERSQKARSVDCCCTCARRRCGLCWTGERERRPS